MTTLRRYAWTIAALFAAAGTFVCGAARAETSGRISVMDDVELLSNPNAMIDAVLLRVYLTSDHLAGKNAKFVVDLRSDLPVVASSGLKYGTGLSTNTKGPFNGYCHGDDFTDRQKCKDIAVRDEQLGQLSHLAGIYDLYLQLGSAGEGKTTYSIGRKTVYEAGLVTVDGLTVEHTLNAEMRAGGFIGTAPDPLTRMFDGYYQTAGGYFALQKRGMWVRFAADALNYAGSDANKFGAEKGALARATVFNQNYFQLSKGMTLATFLELDVIPGPRDRLAYLDFNIRPSGQFRFHMNLTRFRPVDFLSTPELVNGGVFDPALVTTYTNANASTAFLSRTAEVVEFKIRDKPIDSAKVVAHYTTKYSISPLVSAEYRMREIDSKSEILADVGAYAYDPFDSGIVARARVEVQSGFDTTGVRFGGTFERGVAENLALGAGFDVGSFSYKLRNPVVETHYPKSANTLSVNGVARYDTGKFGLFGEAYYLLNTRAVTAGEPGTGSAAGNAGISAPKTYGTISILVGVNVRFGNAKP